MLVTSAAQLGLLLAVISGCCSAAGGLTKEEALLAQKAAVVNWGEWSAANNVTGWQDEWQRVGVDVCSWTGVGCDIYGRIVLSLDLSCYDGDRGLCAVKAQGTISPALADIPSLLTIQLNGQNFSGSLPAWGNGALSKLTTLSLSSNHLSGSLPDSWATAFPELKILVLKDNQVASSLPQSWAAEGAFQSLEQLDLSFNMLPSTLPERWAAPAAFPKLEQLFLDGNQLIGSLPRAWGSPQAFQRLTYLSISMNTLTSSLPLDWGNATALPRLLSLDLSATNLNSTLPAAWATRGGFQRLQQLTLHSNDLSGTIPPAWGSAAAFPRLKGLNLANNPKLCGPVPASLITATCETPAPEGMDCVGSELPACKAYFAKASEQDVAALLAQKAAITNWAEFAAATNTTGWDAAVPVCEWVGITCTDQGSIISVDLSCWGQPDDATQAPPCGVQAQGTLAPELAGIKSLMSIYMYNQRLIGTLPAAYGAPGAFPNLNLFIVDSNMLSGTLPETWGSAQAFPRLQDVLLMHNNLSGTLHDSWGAPGSLPAIKVISLQNNRLSGSLPSSWRAWPFLETLDLANNTLTGTLPDSWGANGSWPRLKNLSLGGNRPATTLPGSDCAATCGLTGSLPATWGSNSSFQALLDLGLNNNSFSSELPGSWGGAGAFPQLGTLELDNIDLQGSFPASWFQPETFPQLYMLSLQGNPQFCGPVPALLQTAACGESSAGCQNGTIACGALAPAPAAPAPAAGPVELGSSSSAPIAAIVGGVVGGLVVVAVLAFLAFRPRRGWLRAESASASQQATPDEGSALVSSNPTARELVPEQDPEALTAPPPGSDEGSGSGLPHSYMTALAPLRALSVARREARERGASADTPAGGSSSSQHNTAGMHRVGSDPLLSLISSRLASLSTEQLRRDAAATPASGSSGPDSSSGLSAEVRQWEVSWDSIRVEMPIGRGSFGNVYLAYWNATPVAVKVLFNPGEGGAEPDLELPAGVGRQLQQEAAVMARMRHPNLVSFLGLCTMPPAILTEYCSRGSLYDLLRQAAADPVCAAQLTWKLRLSMAYDAARGLLYLHMRDPPIVHHDVKSPNLLVDHAYNVKVCDFNLSEILLRHDGSPARTAVTNPTWLAPEVLAGERATRASDVYSYGLVLWELLAWQLPWWRVPPLQVRRKVLEGERPPIPPWDELPGPGAAAFEGLGAYVDLVRDCWAQAPADRPSFSEVVARLGEMLSTPPPPADAAGSVGQQQGEQGELPPGS